MLYPPIEVLGLANGGGSLTYLIDWSERRPRQKPSREHREAKARGGHDEERGLEIHQRFLDWRQRTANLKNANWAPLHIERYRIDSQRPPLHQDGLKDRL